MFSLALCPVRFLFNSGRFCLGALATKTPRIRGLRTIKKEILKLVETYITKAEDMEAVTNVLIPPLLEAVLGDYMRNAESARDAEVLSVMSTIVAKLGVRMQRKWCGVPFISQLTGLFPDCPIQNLITQKVPAILDAVFECTLNMINKDFSEYPEHRVAFFKLLRSININCFPGE